MTNSILTTTPNSQRNELLSPPYAAIDVEYRRNEGSNLQKLFTIFAVALFDSLGIAKVKHASDFANYPHPEKELVKWLMTEMLKYRLTVGWYSKGVRVKKDGTFSGKDSDLKIIDDACKFYGIPSIIGFDKRGVPFVRGYDYGICNIDPYYAKQNKFDWYHHIDLYNIYKKQMVRDISKYKNKSLKLEDVSKAILKEGKYEKLDGKQIQQLPKEKQLQYVCQDAVLVMKLSKHNDYEIFDLMNAVSRITGVRFDRVCHTEISTWWTNILYDKINNGECNLLKLDEDERKKKEAYEGGHVLDPLVGYYCLKDNQTVYVLDVKSLYPTMMILHNISFETVNCSCCKDNPDARIPEEIMRLIKNKSRKEQKSKEYWICLKHVGIIPRLLEQYRNERFKHKDLGNNAMQLGLKILINGCYGLFGSEFFEFADYRVAELTTAFGRQTLSYMKHIAEKVYGFKVIYGDTDSIFVTNVKGEGDINKFLAECFIVLEDVEIELSSVYKKLLLIGKKHYIGIHVVDTKEPDVKGIEGKKSDRPEWINNLQKDFVDDIRYDRDPTIKLHKAYRDMENGRVPSELLAIYLTLRKDPGEYSRNERQKIVGDQLNAKEGDTIKYYKSNTPGKAHSDPAFIDKEKYLKMLKSTFEKQLKVLGYDFSKDVAGVETLDGS